ncbi:MAG: hypothetical protein IJ867_04860 [Clostridia bacterium]|nr:hypothetical protein [Clostridia bacterium]
MKRLRIRFPFEYRDDQTICLPGKMYLNVVGNHTQAFLDKEFTHPIPERFCQADLTVEVPSNIEMIEIAMPIKSTPIDSIIMDWLWASGDKNWKIPGLQKILLISKDETLEIDSVDEKPDSKKLGNLTILTEKNFKRFKKDWALVVYITDQKVYGVFHWNSEFAKKVEDL